VEHSDTQHRYVIKLLVPNCFDAKIAIISAIRGVESGLKALIITP